MNQPRPSAEASLTGLASDAVASTSVWTPTAPRDSDSSELAFVAPLRAATEAVDTLAVDRDGAPGNGDQHVAESTAATAQSTAEKNEESKTGPDSSPGKQRQEKKIPPKAGDLRTAHDGTPDSSPAKTPQRASTQESKPAKTAPGQPEGEPKNTQQRKPDAADGRGKKASPAQSGQQPDTASKKSGDAEPADSQTPEMDFWHKHFVQLRERADRVYDVVLTRLADWTTRFEIGGRFLVGNSDQDFFNVRGRFEKTITKHRYAELDIGGDFAQNRGEKSANRWFANGTYDFSRDGDWILFITTKNEFNEFRNLNWRGTLSGGFGYRFYNEKRKRLIARIGPAVTHEFFFSPTVHRTTPDVLAEMDLKWPIHDRSDFENKLMIRPSVSDLEVFRLENRSGLLFRIDTNERWKLKLGLWIDYNSKPNRFRLRTDYTTLISLVYTRK